MNAVELTAALTVELPTVNPVPLTAALTVELPTVNPVPLTAALTVELPTKIFELPETPEALIVVPPTDIDVIAVELVDILLSIALLMLPTLPKSIAFVIFSLYCFVIFISYGFVGHMMFNGNPG